MRFCGSLWRFVTSGHQIVKDKTLSLAGIVGIFPAARVDGEDVEVYADESRQGIPKNVAVPYSHVGNVMAELETNGLAVPMRG